MHILQSGHELIKEFVSFVKMMYGLFQFLFNDPVLENYLHYINYYVQTQPTVRSVRFMFLVVRLCYLGTTVSNFSYNKDVMNLL